MMVGAVNFENSPTASCGLISLLQRVFDTSLASKAKSIPGTGAGIDCSCGVFAFGFAGSGAQASIFGCVAHTTTSLPVPPAEEIEIIPPGMPSNICTVLSASGVVLYLNPCPCLNCFRLSISGQT